MLRTSEFILNFVLNSCWQIAAIFVVAWVGSWLLKSGPARYRHVLWIVALGACFVMPLLTASRVVPAGISRLQVTASKANPVYKTAQVTPSENLNVDHLVTRRTKSISADTRIALVLTLVYALVILGRGIRLARFWRGKEKLRQSATRAGLPPEIESVAERCRHIFGVDALVTRSDKARVPYAIGVWRPLILLPARFCSSIDEPRLLSIIGHEMAHVARRDFLTNLLCELVALPISFHPLTFLIKRQIDRTRELACDELVTEHVLEPRVYARSLLWGG